MNSKIYIGRVTHNRNNPVKHKLQYPIYFYAFDLDELYLLHKKIWLFSNNRFNVVSLHDRDYLTGKGTIKQKILRILKKRGVFGISRIVLITSARYFNYAFNPVNFYYCYNRRGDIACIAAEVNNTFHERHLYVLDKPKKKMHATRTFEQAKKFHVSPFNSMDGFYKMTFTEPGESISIDITLYRDGKNIMYAQLSGKAQLFQTDKLLGTILKYPLTTLLTVIRIYKEAFKLFFLKKLKYHPKPNPTSNMTILVRNPNRREKVGLYLFKKAMSRISKGHLFVTLPDTSVFGFGNLKQKPGGRMAVLNWNLFWRFVKDGEIGMGESYVDNEWDSEDMPQLLDFYIANMDILENKKGVLTFFSNLFRLMTFKKFRNTRERSKKNIKAHYDLGNDLFNTFLDRNLLYSCAFFQSPKDSLEKAQLNKIHILINKTGIKSGDRVLEIGTGWGGFAVEAVKKTGCHVTTITLSNEQYSYVKEKIKKLGLSKQIDVRLSDYRDMQGRFDRIISIEMLEAVGCEYYDIFFRQCEKLLAPGGTIGLQIITMPDCRFDEYRRNVDWIQTYIFPGGFLPSLHILSEAMKNNSKFHIEHLENIGIHYARTLRIWRERFLKNLQKLQGIGYDAKFQRIWQYYLYICEAAFKNRILNDLQIILTRQGNQTI